MTKLISVVIPNFNYGKFLNQTIDSALNQTYKNVEVIVIDNGSSDSSRDIIRTYGKDIKSIFQSNLGQAEARNNGIKLAKGDLIALLDADDYWNPSKLEAQIQIINAQNQFIYSGVRQFQSESGETLREIAPKFRGSCEFDFLNFPTLAIIPGGESSVLLTRDLIENVGLFDVRLNSASGRDFFRRCSKYTGFSFASEPLVNYRMHNSNMSRNSRNIMLDTEKSYQILFEDPEWNFAIPYRRECFGMLYWSFIKTSLKNFDLAGTSSFVLNSLKQNFQRS